jgi:hypothetical protein
VPVGGGAQVRRSRVGAQLGDAEVEQLDHLCPVAAARQEDVVGLEAAVDDRLGVRG